jgi:hypothetical protein
MKLKSTVMFFHYFVWCFFTLIEEIRMQKDDAYLDTCASFKVYLHTAHFSKKRSGEQACAGYVIILFVDPISSLSL